MRHCEAQRACNLCRALSKVPDEVAVYTRQTSDKRELMLPRMDHPAPQ